VPEGKRVVCAVGGVQALSDGFLNCCPSEMLADTGITASLVDKRVLKRLDRASEALRPYEGGLESISGLGIRGRLTCDAADGVHGVAVRDSRRPARIRKLENRLSSGVPCCERSERSKTGDINWEYLRRSREAPTVGTHGVPHRGASVEVGEPTRILTRGERSKKVVEVVAVNDVPFVTGVTIGLGL
jgi:hypothetical protein